MTVDSGFPEGTFLDPLLFLCHINDLPDALKSTVCLFADDCLLNRSIRNRDNHLALERDLPKLETWAHTLGECVLMRRNSTLKLHSL